MSYRINTLSTAARPIQRTSVPIAAETLIATYTCRCGWRGPDKGERRYHMETPGHLALPDAHPTLHVECNEWSCPHSEDDCPITDCLAWTLEFGVCMQCRGPARTYAHDGSKRQPFKYHYVLASDRALG